jgi:polyhydroxybutyrate depolymerase
VLLFHGSPSNGRDIQLFTGFDAVADARGFVTVYPDGIAGSWGVGCNCTQADALGVDDVLLVRSLIGQLARDRPVDASRVYAVGYSQGAMFSHRLACDLSDRLVAVAAVAGQLPRLVSSRCAPIRPISLLMFHGTADPNVPWQGGLHLLSTPQTAERWAELNGCAGKAVDPLPDLAVDGTTVTRDSYANCAMDVETVLYTIHNGGHTWPGSPLVFPDHYGPMTRDISASELIGELFSRRSLP